ncbi:MAG: indole-3-glycerol phosphate synthase TrpC [Deltaproteobacteria bacterium]|nr:indole-3-glycerol phosphate synthase TrpC [Deltaproteobacteria bacterium]
MAVPGILREIVEHKKAALAALFKEKPRKERIAGFEAEIRLTPKTRGFEAALLGEGVRVIAEVKKASPSKGIIRADFDPVAVALTYEKNGAAAISVLTDEKYFMGSLENLVRIREKVSLPLLRKDFIVDEYQICEARAVGADAILLIAAALDKGRMKELMDAASALGLDSLIEVHTEKELDAALDIGAKLIGINNRDLNTFVTDINTTVRLIERIPAEKTVVTESGINRIEDVRLLDAAGVDAFLIGESLMREADIGKKLRELRGA